MTITSFASFDANDSCAEIGADDMVFWLQPQSTAQVDRCENVPPRYLFLRLTASLSLSAFMTFGSISAAIAPATARTTPPSDLTIRSEPSLAIELPPEPSFDPERISRVDDEIRLASLPAIDDAALSVISANEPMEAVVSLPMNAEEQLPGVTEAAPLNMAGIAGAPGSVAASPDEVLADIVID